jgi:hypothetical protein
MTNNNEKKVLTKSERWSLKTSLKEEITAIEKDLGEILSELDEKTARKDPEIAHVLDYLDKKRIELAAVDFYEFVKLMWPYAQTGSHFKEQWYIHAICDHVEYLYDLEFLKLIVSISPRSGKSTMLSQLAPPWLWIQDPTMSFITGSYGNELAKRDTVKSRDIINSSFFQSHFGKYVQLKPGQQEKVNYSTTDGGNRIIVSPEGKSTGYGAHFLLIDDPHKAKEFNSQTALNKVWEWYQNTLSTRWQTPETFRRVVMHQRGNDSDLAGRLEREEDNWVVLSLPERYEGIKVIGYKWEDPRKYEGELLKPDLLGEEEAVELEQKNPLLWAAQFQQNPQSATGNYITDSDLSWYTYSDLPAKVDFDFFVSTWDLTDGDIDEDACDTVGMMFGLLGRKKYAFDRVADKMTFPQQLSAFLEMRDKYNEYCHLHLVEYHSNGRAFIDYLEKEHEVEGLVPIIARDYGGDKLSRFFACLPEFVGRHVYLPDNGWGQLVAKRLKGFPKLKEKDDVDCITQLLNWRFYNQDVTKHMMSHREEVNLMLEEGVKDPYNVYGERNYNVFEDVISPLELFGV